MRSSGPAALAVGVLLIADLVAPAGLASQPGTPRPPALAAGAAVETGIDVLRGSRFSLLDGKRVGLLTNLAARASDGDLTVDAMRAALGPRLVALFAPEHGLSASEDTDVPSSRDPRTGLQVHSLYGETQRPTPAMLQGLDVLVIDLPDVGARFYTYMTTVAYVLEEAARSRLAVMVLDRPNPIGGTTIEGPSLDPDLVSFVGYFPMPVRHGLTLGELARLFNGERALGASLTVVEARGWQRAMWFDETGLPWSNPSPNIRSLTAATLYPGLGAVEWSNVSVGRGTEMPFEQVGAPWIDGRRLAEVLNARGIPGVTFSAVAFTPASSMYAGQPCGGVAMAITDRLRLRSVRMGIEIASALRRLYPDRFDPGRTVQLLGSRDTLNRIRNGEDPAVIADLWLRDEARWREVREKYLLYR